jgi:hypothetical protein
MEAERHTGCLRTCGEVTRCRFSLLRNIDIVGARLPRPSQDTGKHAGDCKGVGGGGGRRLLMWWVVCVTDFARVVRLRMVRRAGGGLPGLRYIHLQTRA